MFQNVVVMISLSWFTCTSYCLKYVKISIFIDSSSLSGVFFYNKMFHHFLLLFKQSKLRILKYFFSFIFMILHSWNMFFHLSIVLFYYLFISPVLAVWSSFFSPFWLCLLFPFLRLVDLFFSHSFTLIVGTARSWPCRGDCFSSVTTGRLVVVAATAAALQLQQLVGSAIPSISLSLSLSRALALFFLLFCLSFLHSLARSRPSICVFFACILATLAFVRSCTLGEALSVAQQPPADTILQSHLTFFVLWRFFLSFFNIKFFSLFLTEIIQNVRRRSRCFGHWQRLWHVQGRFRRWRCSPSSFPIHRRSSPSPGKFYLE